MMGFLSTASAHVKGSTRPRAGSSNTNGEGAPEGTDPDDTSILSVRLLLPPQCPSGLKPLMIAGVEMRRRGP